MPVSNRHILEQRASLGALGRVALRSLEQQLFRKKSGATPIVPGPTVEATIAPRRAELIRAYVQNVGGNPSAYAGIVPAHFFSQWAFGLASQVLEDLPYPLSRVLNVGCNLTVRAPMPAGEPLTVRARLENIDDDGRRVVLTTRVVTSTRNVPDALTADMIAMVPLKRGKSADGKGSDKRETPTAPKDARELARFTADARAGLDFAKLTGDFNPIHWLPPAARAAGFPNVILHGFGTMARAIEALNRTALEGDVTRLKKWSCRFTKPLVLPAEAGLYVRGNEVFVAKAQGEPAYLVGSYET